MVNSTRRPIEFGKFRSESAAMLHGARSGKQVSGIHQFHRERYIEQRKADDLFQLTYRDGRRPFFISG